MIQRLQQKRNEEGFTLIELLIVIIVLGILAAIVVFAVGSTRKDSVASACKTNYKAVELSAEAVNTRTGTYGPVADLSDSAKGGLFKTGGYPTSDDYNLAYAQAGSPLGSSYTITVQKKAADGTWVNVATNPTTVEGCKAL